MSLRVWESPAQYSDQAPAVPSLPRAALLISFHIYPFLRDTYIDDTDHSKREFSILYLSLFLWLLSSLKSPTKKKKKIKLRAVVCELITGYQNWCPFQILTSLQRWTGLFSWLMLMGHSSLQEQTGGGGFFPWVMGTFSKWDFITVTVSECEPPHLCDISSSSTNYGHLCHEKQGN